MPLYVALIEIPTTQSDQPADTFVDALREYAHPRLHVTIEAPSKRSAASQLAESTAYGADVPTWNFPEYSAAWWFDRLQVVLSKREAARLRDRISQ